VRLRAMSQHSVRAPNNFELFQAQYSGVFVPVFDPQDDPCSASQSPEANGIASKCIAQGLAPSQVGVFEATLGLPVVWVAGGNPDLEPEEADTLTVGLVIGPASLPDWEFAVDYFNLEMDGGIGDISAFNICFDQSNTSDIFCDKIQRSATGDIVRVEELFQNRGLFSTAGIDTQVRYNGDMPGWLGGDRGLKLDFGLVWTHVLEYEAQQNPVSSVLDCLGYFGAPCQNALGLASENRVSANLGISGDRLRAALSMQWIDGAENWGKVDHLYYGGPPAVLAIPSIGSRFYADLNVSYEFSDGISAALGVTNLLGTNPPQMADGSATGNNAEAGLYDLFGRSYRVTFAYRFGD